MPCQRLPLPLPVQEEDEDGMRRRQPKFGEPGFRFHAAIPQVGPGRGRVEGGEAPTCMLHDTAQLPAPPGLPATLLICPQRLAHPPDMQLSPTLPYPAHPPIPYCYHYRSLQAAQLDYVKAPTGQYAMPEKKKVGSGKDKGGAAGEHKLTKKLKGMAAKGGRPGRAAVVSVEGRNVTIQH